MRCTPKVSKLLRESGQCAASDDAQPPLTKTATTWNGGAIPLGYALPSPTSTRLISSMHNALANSESSAHGLPGSTSHHVLGVRVWLVAGVDQLHRLQAE